MIVDPEKWAAASGCGPEQVIGNIGRYLEDKVLGLDLVRDAGAQVLVKTRDVQQPPESRAEPEGRPQ